MRKNKEITMLTQGYVIWLIIALMTFLTWLICTVLLYSGLQYINLVSSDYSLVIGAVLSTVAVGLGEHRFFNKY